MSCRKENKDTGQQGIPAEVLAKIKSEGLSTTGVKKFKDGYIVEGDIFLSGKWFESKEKGEAKKLRIAETEQFKTYNLVSVFGSREITVSIEGFPSIYVSALDEALARYNALGLNLTFRRINAGGEITIIQEWLNGSLGIAGFPTADGNPYNLIRLSVDAIGGAGQAAIATIIAHEMGHCIGFRHTDYYDRRISNCPGSVINEGEGSEGAVLIPGTPSAAENFSWMLACVGFNESRPFTANDIVALRYLYGNVQPVPNGVYRITAVHSGQVFDVYDASTSQLATIIQYPWNGDNNQRWQFTFLGNGYYKIIAMHSGLAMSYIGNGPFLALRLRQVTWDNAKLQQWKITQVQPGQFAIECRGNGQVLDVFDASTAYGAEIITFPWNGDGNQRFILTQL